MNLTVCSSLQYQWRLSTASLHFTCPWTGSCLHSVLLPDQHTEEGWSQGSFWRMSDSQLLYPWTVFVKWYRILPSHLISWPLVDFFPLIPLYITLFPAPSPSSALCFIIFSISVFWGRFDLSRVWLTVSTFELCWVSAFEGCSHFFWKYICKKDRVNLS